jgi:endonuclease/exonuclease/phosphatase family metal-dependent hydrolase
MPWRRPRRLTSSFGRCTMLLLLTGCAGAVNYTDPAAPRYAAAALRPSTRDGGGLRIVSFNIQYAEHIDRALQVLRTDPALKDADILLLQEMDEPGTVAIAESLGMHWVYYPASVARNGRDFGNAILSCWPLEQDAKIVLPHIAWLRGNQRIAVAATARISGRAFRVYNVHLATPFGNRPKARREQLATVLDDADRYPDVIIGGDFNSETVPEIALARGYTWPTRRLPHTTKLWTLDHILLKGDLAARSPSVGVAHDNLEASDHRPIWAMVSFEP